MTNTTPMNSEQVEQVEAVLPCPFCDGTWVIINRPANGSQPAVKCKACNATGPYTAGMSDEQVSAAWNRRALPQAQAAVDVERVKIAASSEEAIACLEIRSDLNRAIFAVLNGYRMSNMGDEDGYPYPLVDLMSNPAPADISTGEAEMVSLADDICEAVEAHLAALPPVIAESAGGGETIPADIAEHVRKVGRVEWGQTPAHDAEGHGKHVADSVRITAAHFGQTEDQHMHGLWLEGTDTVLCHTGTSPNAPMTTRALVGAWNWLVDQCSPATLATPSPIAEAVEALEVGQTSRGFAVARGVDIYGQPYSVQDSSLADQDAIWLGSDAERSRAHLTREMVAGLLPLLHRFVATGTLRASMEPGA